MTAGSSNPISAHFADAERVLVGDRAMTQNIEVLFSVGAALFLFFPQNR